MGRSWTGNSQKTPRDSCSSRVTLRWTAFVTGAALINELRFISGLEGLRRMTCESLIIHGDADSIVPYASSERFAQDV